MLASSMRRPGQHLSHLVVQFTGEIFSLLLLSCSDLDGQEP